jgi:hypothetical protein
MGKGKAAWWTSLGYGRDKGVPNSWSFNQESMNRGEGKPREALLSAETGTALNFRSLTYIRMYCKMSRSFFLFYIDHIVATICQFVEFQLQRQLRASAGQAPGGKVANKDEHACIDVVFFLNRRASHSASST